MALPKTVIDLIKEVSRKYPDSPALKFKNSYLSYKELEEKSDELAFQLLQNGLNLEDKVVVFLPLSFELVISTYAILKAGGCYVPLSLKDGKDRFINIMEELECNIILGNSETLSSRIPLTSAKLFDLNLSKKNWIESVGAQVSPKMPVSFPEIAPGNLSYLLYTSGTTGRPKGAMMEHGNLYSYMLALQKIYPIGRESRILQNPNNVFDSSIITMASGKAACTISYPHLGTYKVTNPEPALKAALADRITAPIFP